MILLWISRRKRPKKLDSDMINHYDKFYLGNHYLVHTSRDVGIIISTDQAKEIFKGWDTIKILINNSYPYQDIILTWNGLKKEPSRRVLATILNQLLWFKTSISDRPMFIGIDRIQGIPEDFYQIYERESILR